MRYLREQPEGLSCDHSNGLNFVRVGEPHQRRHGLSLEHCELLFGYESCEELEPAVAALLVPLFEHAHCELKELSELLFIQLETCQHELSQLASDGGLRLAFLLPCCFSEHQQHRGPGTGLPRQEPRQRLVDGSPLDAFALAEEEEAALALAQIFFKGEPANFVFSLQIC